MNKYLKTIIIFFVILTGLTAAFYGGMWVGSGLGVNEEQTNYLTSSDPELGTLFTPFFQVGYHP